MSVESSFGDGYYEGKAIGMEQGIQHGMEQSTKTIAKKLLHKGENTENIADLTGLSIVEIENLR